MNLPDPLLQLGFATMLDAARDSVLLEALQQAVGTLSVMEIDRELADYVPRDAHARLASKGLRGETYFPVPALLIKKPNLLGYYRLLYGFSQKQFYGSATGCSIFKSMEFSDRLNLRAQTLLPELCRAFAVAGSILVGGLGASIKSQMFANELCILTLGAQFRGSYNNTIGSDGIKAVFSILSSIFENEIRKSDRRSLEIESATGRSVRIEISADPDILISSKMPDGNDRSVVAIEVKAGEDHSNIWNRVGEAEKSHLKARARGVAECWTIINDPQAGTTDLHASSPSTHRFYQLVDLTNNQSAGRADFASRVRDMVGL